MVKEARLSKTRLQNMRGDHIALDSMLINYLNLSVSDLSAIRKGPIQQRIPRAAQAIYAATKDSTQITEFILAAVISDDWDDPHSWDGMVAARLSKTFRHTRLEKESETSLRLTNMQLLRESVGAYHGNLYEARQVWKRFQAGKGDWLRSVRIPLRIGADESTLLGAEWATGYISKANGFVNFTVSLEDVDFYRAINNLFGEIHGIQGKMVLLSRSATPPRSAKKYEWVAYSLIVFSKAIATWLVDDLGFGTESPLPTIEWNAARRRSFLKGVIGAKGIVTGRGQLEIADKKEGFVKAIANMSEELGFTPTTSVYHRELGNPTHMIWFSLKEVRKMRDEGFLINPSHLLRLNMQRRRLAVECEFPGI